MMRQVVARLAGVAAVIVVGALPLGAQDVMWQAATGGVAGAPQEQAAIAGQPPIGPLLAGGMDVMGGPVVFGGEKVTGAPYSAEAVTEVVQQLADGNRIVRRNRASVYRDGAGRTRRETGLAVVGGLVAEPAEQRLVQITDPETNVSYLLDLNQHVAHKLMIPRIEPGSLSYVATHERHSDGSAPPAGPPATFEIPLPPPTTMTFTESASIGSVDHGAGAQVMYGRRVFRSSSDAAPPVVESLGTQTMEGVTVEGTRSTMTIPAGQVGNEQPINVVYERWFSPELKVLVSSRQSDPRFGETTYRLTNIVRAEPATELFEVPSDFKVVSPDVKRDVIIRKR